MSVKYKYRARKGSLFLTGSIEAQNEEEANAKLKDQGLTVISLSKEREQAVSYMDQPSETPVPKKPEPVQKFDTFTSSREFTPKIIKEEKKPLLSPQAKKVLGYGGIVLGVLCVIMIPFIFRGESKGGGKDKDVSFNIVKTSDITAEPNIKDFIVQVERAASKNGIKDVALKIIKKKKSGFEKKQRVIFHFYYKDQDVKVEKAIAVLRWNWYGKENWEYSFSLERGAKTDKKLQVKQQELQKGKFVKYKVIVPSHVKVNGAKVMMKGEIEKLQKKWSGKVEKINIDAIYENFDSPFMTCEVKSQPGSYRSTDCRLVTKRF